MFWKKSTKEEANTVPTDTSGAEVNEGADITETKDVNLMQFFLPFVKNLMNSKGNASRLPYPPRFYLHSSSLQHTMNLKLNSIGLLEMAVQQGDPQSRFFAVLRYYFSVVGVTKFPYKPIIAMEGETSHHSVSHPDGSRTFALAEEIVHDPPHCAFYIANPDRGVVHDGNVQLDPKFEKGHVRVRIGGNNRIVLRDPQGRFEEVYESTAPDIMVSLLRMRTELMGEVSLVCQASGYAARIIFKEKPMIGGHKNGVTGSITLNGSEVFRLDGIWDESIYLTDLANQRAELFNRKTCPRDRIDTPPLDSLPMTAGERIWGPLIELLKQENFTDAQTLKLKLNETENAERALRRQNNVQPTYFIKNPTTGFWQMKDPSQAVMLGSGSGAFCGRPSQ